MSWRLSFTADGPFRVLWMLQMCVDMRSIYIASCPSLDIAAFR